MNENFEDTLNKGIQQSNAGNQKKAIELLLRCESMQQDNDWVSLNLANCYIKNNEADFAIVCFQKILSGKPSDIKILLNLSKLTIIVYRFDLAVIACELAEKVEPNSLDVLAALVQAKKEARKGKGIKKLCKKMISLLPSNPWAFTQLAGNYLANGKFEKAEKIYQKALICDSNYSFTYTGLVKSVKYKNKPKKLICQLDSAITCNQGAEAKARLLLAKAKILNDCGEYRKAWKTAKKGKKIKASIAPFDIENFKLHIKKVKEYYTRSSSRVVADNVSSPVCIVGMPRSGTTLVEQILSTYPEFYPGGETPALDYSIFRQVKGGSYLNNDLNVKQLNHMAKDYESFFKRFSNYTGSRIIDKVPMHFLHIGIYMQMFPNAKFINFERNKYDVTTSILFENFSLMNNFTHKISDILQVYSCYQELMVFWQNLYPHSVLTVNYDDFVLQHEKTKKKILDYIGLNAAAKMDFKDAGNVIETPSVWQARQSIYKTSVNRWKRYPQMVKVVDRLLK